WRVDHCKARDKAMLLLGPRADEHVAGEEAMPGALGDDAHGQAVVGVGTSKDILNEDVAATQKGGQAHVQTLENVLADGAVGVTTAAVARGAGFFNNEGILRRAAGAGAGRGEEAPSRLSCASLRPITHS